MSALTEFIDKIIQRFPPSFRWDEAQKASWSQDMVDELGGFSDEVLKRAVRTIIATRKDKSTPLVSECIGSCLEAKKWLDAERSAGQLPGIRAETSDFWSDERMRLAGELLRTPLGRQSATDNPCWVLRFRDFVLKNGRAPQSAAEIEQCKRDVREFDRLYADCVAGRGGRFNDALAKLGASMLAKREKLRAEVLGR